MRKEHPLIYELINYADDILLDKPLSCVKHKQACQRFLKDLRKRKKKSYEYEFIPEKAERFVNWCRLFRHTKGVLKGKRIDLRQSPIAFFIACNLYGWYNKSTGYRRFNKLYWQVARKNMKSQFLSLIGSYEAMAFNQAQDEVMEVYCAATKKEQAKIVYDEMKIMLNRCPELSGKYNTANFRITHLRSESFIKVLSDDDKKKGDGLNPQCGIIDEFHAHKTTEVYDVVEDGMNRTQPLMAVITTAGSDLTNPCFTIEYKLVSKILDPNNPVEMDNYFVMINELDKDENGEVTDNIKDSKVWIKANPIRASYPEGIKKISEKMKEAVEEPAKMRNFLTKIMNVWVHLTEISYMSPVVWNKCATKRKYFPRLKGRSVYLGLDFSSKNDLTSFGFEIPMDGKYVVLGHSFMPRENFELKLKTDRVPYDIWAKEGWITVMNYPIIDFREAIGFAKEWVEENNWYVEEWCLDPWSASQIMSWLIEEGETVTEIRQGSRTLSEPTKDFRDMVKSGNVIHDGNPVISWAIGNAIAKEVDRNRNIVLDKSKSPERIDPLACIINAHTRAMGAEFDCDPQFFVA